MSVGPKKQPESQREANPCMTFHMTSLWKAMGLIPFRKWDFFLGSTLTVVCWPLASRNNTLASRNLEQLAILAWRKLPKKLSD